MDRRRIYLAQGFPSLFQYLLSEFHLSEYATYNRILAARLGRKHPLIFALVEQEKIHLCGLKVLSPILNQENHVELLSQACGKSKREVEHLVAQYRPQAPVEDCVRKLPKLTASKNVTENKNSGSQGSRFSSVSSQIRASSSSEAKNDSSCSATPHQHNRVAVLSEETYKIQFTAGTELKNKLEEARALLSHELPSGSLAQVLEKALDLLIARKKSQRFGLGKRSRDEGSKGFEKERKVLRRHIPVEIRRQVYLRDGGSCRFQGRQGQVCGSTHQLEYEHKRPWALGGDHSLSNISLYCRQHNAYMRERSFGPLKQE